MALLLRGKTYYAYWYQKVYDPESGKWTRKKKFKVLGYKPDMLKSTAKAIHDELMRERRFGKLDFVVRVPALSEFIPEFLEHQKSVNKPKTLRQYKYVLEYFKAYFGADRSLTSISELDVREYIRKRESEGRTPATILQEITMLKRFFNVAKILRKFPGENPVSRIQYKVRTSSKGRVLTPDEQAKFLAALSPKMKTIVQVALLTGMRKSEILNLEWERVDLRNDFIYLPENKTDKPRKVPISSELKPIITEQKLTTGFQPYVFITKDRRPYSPNSTTFYSVFKAGIRKAGLEFFRFHDLRHTAITAMLERGAVPIAVSRIAGHKNLRTTMIYAHPDQSLREAVELLTSEVGSKVDTKVK